MKTGMIVLADIAASTLGIALLLLFIIVNLQNDDHTTASSQHTREISETFETVTGPPLSSSDMVLRLHERTQPSAHGTLMIDAFSNRLVLAGVGIPHLEDPLILTGDGPDVQAGFQALLDQGLGSDRTVLVFVFDTAMQVQMRSAMLRFDGVHINVTVPAALKSIDPDGQEIWHPDFASLMNKTYSRPIFVERLTQILAGANTDPTSSEPSATITYGDLFSNLKTNGYAVIGWILMVLFYGVSIGVICFIERGFWQGRGKKSSEC